MFYLSERGVLSGLGAMLVRCDRPPSSVPSLIARDVSPPRFSGVSDFRISRFLRQIISTEIYAATSCGQYVLSVLIHVEYEAEKGCSSPKGPFFWGDPRKKAKWSLCAAAAPDEGIINLVSDCSGIGLAARGVGHELIGDNRQRDHVTRRFTLRFVNSTILFDLLQHHPHSVRCPWTAHTT